MEQVKVENEKYAIMVYFPSNPETGKNLLDERFLDCWIKESCHRYLDAAKRTMRMRRESWKGIDGVQFKVVEIRP